MRKRTGVVRVERSPWIYHAVDLLQRQSITREVICCHCGGKFKPKKKRRKWMMFAERRETAVRVDVTDVRLVTCIIDPPVCLSVCVRVCVSVCVTRRSYSSVTPTSDGRRYVLSFVRRR